MSIDIRRSVGAWLEAASYCVCAVNAGTADRRQCTVYFSFSRKRATRLKYPTLISGGVDGCNGF
ncbi:hypothetical protein [Chroococcidiopsis sp. TS-821]|uniref:hypothetical protein n=1 Tax=Chroococcidiopsis sp. TS-821 TaxID=1378066 RepID=UPI0011B044FA|nr:hypothetical protein [Chroococcidiopsis sp. TS-821]